MAAGCLPTGVVRETCPPEDGFRLIPGVSMPRGSRPDSCGPAALAAVMNFWKDSVTVGQLESAILRFDAHGMDTRDFLLVANRRGFVGQYERGSIGRVKNAVDARTPPIIAMPGHALVAVGYNDRTQEMIFAETLDRYRAIAYRDFMPAWAAAGFFFIILTPGSASELVALGDRVRDRGQWREAEAFYDQAIEREPGFAPAYAGRGDLYRLWSRLPQSEAAYREALNRDPSLVRALNNLSDLLIARGGDEKEASALAERAVVLAEAEWRRLWADYESAKTPDLRTDLSGRLRRAMIEHLSVLGTLGQARRAAGDVAGAIAAWREGVRLAPEEMREYRAYRLFEIGGNLGIDAGEEARQNLESAAALTADVSLKRKIAEAQAALERARGTGSAPPPK
jgi:tetratricopeptide (TPR) repeat protein